MYLDVLNWSQIKYACFIQHIAAVCISSESSPKKINASILSIPTYLKNLIYMLVFRWYIYKILKWFLILQVKKYWIIFWCYITIRVSLCIFEYFTCNWSNLIYSCTLISKELISKIVIQNKLNTAVQNFLFRCLYLDDIYRTKVMI